LVSEAPGDVEGLLMVGAGGGRVAEFVGDVAELAESPGEVALGLGGVEWVRGVLSDVEGLLVVGGGGGGVAEVAGDVTEPVEADREVT
jgi:hypothetical protein